MSDIIILEGAAEKRAEAKQMSFSMESINKFLYRSQKLKIAHKVLFFRLLATMVNAGLPILKSIEVLGKQEKNPLLSLLYDELKKDLRGGKHLSQSLAAYHGNFNPSECSLIEAGEKTGRLNVSLLQLSDQIERIYSVTRKFKGAMTYPMAIMIVMTGAVAVIMTVIVPRVVEIFGDKSKLPPLTQFLIATSDFLVYDGIYLVIGVALIVLGISIWKKTPRGRYGWAWIMLRLPIFGPILQKIILSRFARVFSNLLANGISVVESLRIVSDAVDNEVYRQRFLLLREDVKKGIKIGESLEDDQLFPDIIVQMIKIGEETAKLDSIIIKLADFYDEEVNIVVDSIQKILEPVIIVTLAVVVGFVAVGIMQPIMNMADVVSNS